MGAIVGVNHSCGSNGCNPSELVFCGADPESQVPDGPHPRLASSGTRLTSSLHTGPFSVSHNAPETGSKANPKELRMPDAHMAGSAVPAGSKRRIFPRSEDGS